MVGVKKEFQGKKLGYYVSLKALLDMKERGYKACVLQTDDFREAAIKTYLRLGFDPYITHENHPERWVRIRKNLNI
jgi:mycothiol synthase